MNSIVNYKAWIAKYVLDLLAKYSAVATAFALPLSTAVTEVLFIVTVMLNLAAGDWRKKYNLIVHNPVAIVMLGFFALFIVGLTYTTAPFFDGLKMVAKYDKIFFAVLLMPLFTEEKWRHRAINAFIAAVFVVLFISYLNALFLHYNIFAILTAKLALSNKHIFYSLIVSFTSYLLMLRIFATQDLQKRIIYAVLLALMIFYLFFVQDGRSGCYVFLGLVVLFFIQKLGKKGLLFAGVSLIILASLVLSFSHVFKDKLQQTISEMQTYQQNSNTSVGLRMEFAANSLSLIKAHPIFGTGTGSFVKEYATLKPKSNVLTTNPHNQYLHIGVQFGIFGILLLLVMFGSQLWYSRYLSLDVRFIAQALVIAIMLGSLANSWIFDSQEGHFYAFFVALTFAALSKIKRAPKFVPWK